jgi:hypothetical protein
MDEVRGRVPDTSDHPSSLVAAAPEMMSGKENEIG